MQNKKLNLLLVAIFGATLIGCNGGSDGGGGDNPPGPGGLSLSFDTPSAVKNSSYTNATVSLNNSNVATSSYSVTIYSSDYAVIGVAPDSPSCVLSKATPECVVKLYAGTIGEANVSANASGLNSVTNKIVVSTNPQPDPSGLKLNGKYVLSGTFGAVTNKKLTLTNNVSADIDGDGWHEMPLGAPRIDSYVFAKDRFVTPTLFSDDGINWYSTRTIPTDSNPENIYYDNQNQKYLLPSLQSIDGITWTSFNNQGKVPLVYGNNRYLSLKQYEGNEGFYSLDNAQNWLQMVDNVFVAATFKSEVTLYFNGSKFIASSNFPYNYRKNYLFSSDGSNWQQINYPIYQLSSTNDYRNCTIKQLNNRFYCFANRDGDSTSIESMSAVSQSADGINWNESQALVLNGESDLNQSSVSYVNYKFYADCSGKIFPTKTVNGYKTCVSSDGINWSLLDYLPASVGADSKFGSNQVFQTISYQYGKYFLFGRRLNDEDNSGKIWYSTDNMQTWTQTVSGITVSNYNTFQSTTGLSFVLGTMGSNIKQTAIAYSTDNSASFKMATVPTLDKTPRSIATSGHDYVVVGDAGTMLHSVDGKTWTQVDISNITTSDLTTVRYINGTYYAVGDLGYVLTSTNGTTWNYSQVSANPRLMDIVYDNSKFFVVGYGGYIGYSANATNWIRATTPNQNQVNSIAFGNGVYIAAGNNGVLWTSSNGIQWAQISADNILNTAGSQTSLSTYNINSIVYDTQDGFVAVGNNGLVMKSVDGVSWTVGNSSDDSYEDITQLN